MPARISENSGGEHRLEIDALIWQPTSAGTSPNSGAATYDSSPGQRILHVAPHDGLFVLSLGQAFSRTAYAAVPSGSVCIRTVGGIGRQQIIRDGVSKKF